MNDNSNKKISVVCPCYNEEKSIRLLYKRILDVFQNLPCYDFEIIFVDDFSRDKTRVLIEEICKEDSRVKAVFNAKNFGFHRNVFSALTYGTGDAVFLLFGDLQDPPEMLLSFIQRWENGDKVIVGQRTKSHESLTMKFMRFLYYKIVDWFGDTPQIAYFTGFGLYDRIFIDTLKDISDVQPYMKAVVAEYGMDLAIVPYSQAPSKRGKSNFKFWGNYDFAMHGITSSTKMLLRLSTFFGVSIGIVCLCLAGFILIRKLLNWDVTPVGLASISIGIYFLGAVELFFLGILGEYVLSINERITRKPRVVIERTINFTENSGSRKK